MKQYKSFSEVRENSGLLQAINYKILQLRNENPAFDKFMAYNFPGRSISTLCKDYEVYFDIKGRIQSFDPNPDFSKPAQIDQSKLPMQFARNMKFILDYFSSL